jgi:polysaccharide deacetylase family protein (PEP-CTERM system associated)
MAKTFLFSVDLEDVRERMPDGERYKPRVAEMTSRYLAFLKKHGCTATFFVVGQTAAANPEVIRAITEAGHEIALHSSRHTPLDTLGRERFARDLEENIAVLKRLGASAIRGFRAPVLSMTQATSWAYPILKQYGIDYSSSVLPAKNPLYGWPEHTGALSLHEGVAELPVSLLPYAALPVPCAGGTYFRALPLTLLARGFDSANKAGRPVVGYLHPYDIDTQQERFMHPDIRGNRLLNFLMYYNRKSVFPKLEALLERGYSIMRYDAFIDANPMHD